MAGAVFISLAEPQLMPKVYGQRKKKKKKNRFYLCILYNTEQLLCLTTILHRQASRSPSSFTFNSTHTPSHSHSLLIFLRQLIVKVDTEVRRKSHLRAASPLPNLSLLPLDPFSHCFPCSLPLHSILTFTCCSGSTLCCVMCCVDKKIYWHFVCLVPYPHSLPPWPGHGSGLLPLGRTACKCRKLCDY